MKQDDGVIEKIVQAFLIVVLFCLLLAGLLAIFVFGFAGFFKIFSVHYETNYALIHYVLLLIPLTLLFEFFTIFILLRLKKIVAHPLSIKLFSVFLTYLFIWIPLYITDHIISGIHVPLITELAAALLLFALDRVFGKSVGT